MDRFWEFAGRMLRHKRALTGALVMAGISAGGLGAGLLGVLPILRNILVTDDGGEPLRDLAGRLNQSWAGPLIPDRWIGALPDDRFASVVWIMIGLAFLTVLGAIANFLHAYLSLTVVTRSIAHIRREAFRHVIHLPLGTVVTAGPSDLISRIVYDSATLARGFNALLSRGVAQVTKGAVALIVAFIVDWRLASVAIIVAPLLATIIRKLGKRIRRASRKALESQAGLYHRADEVLGGIRVVKAYNRERAEAARFHQVNKRVVEQELRVRKARAIASPLIETLTIFVLGGLSIVAAKAIIDGDLKTTDFFVTLAALGVAGGSLKPLTGIMNDIQQASAASMRIGELLAMTPEAGHGRDLPKLPRHTESVVIRDVTFTYPASDEPAIRNINVTIDHGQTIAFVGPNGSGKTTLLSLVPRLLEPDAGAIEIDGLDISTLNVRSVRRQIGVVTQDVVLFKGTIAENIAYGVDGATEEQIRTAAQRARAEEFILARPEGYQTPMGEDGAGLSGGQRQRLAIARAILREPSILILDEATSMIDADSEAKITEALSEFTKGRTCLVVAHRLSTVVNADRIVVMDHANVVDQGTHDQLLARCEVYQTLAQHQLLRPANNDD